jgi:hypothetical protein
MRRPLCRSSEVAKADVQSQLRLMHLFLARATVGSAESVDAPRARVARLTIFSSAPSGGAKRLKKVLLRLVDKAISVERHPIGMTAAVAIADRAKAAPPA